MASLKVGIIGTGRISDLHVLGYLDSERADIAAICDIRLDRANRRGKSWGVPSDRIFSDYHDLLSLSEIDLVEILLPHNLHYQVAMDAIAAGKHVSMQKPMAFSLEEADEMISAYKNAGVILTVFENFIHYPPIVLAKELIEAGEIGDPLTIRIKSNHGQSPNAWDMSEDAFAWRFDPKQSGGGLFNWDGGLHQFATLWFLMGIPDKVFAFIGATEVLGGVWDLPAVVSWKLPGNRFGSLEVAVSPELLVDSSYYASDDRIEVTGTRGVIWVTRVHGKLLDVPPLILYRDGQLRTFSDIPSGFEQSFINFTQKIIDALYGGNPPSLTAEEGRDILRLVLAVQESAQTEKAVIV